MTFINDALRRLSPGDRDDAIPATSQASEAFPARTVALVLAAIVMTIAALLYPDLKTPFLGDDGFNANFIGIMGYDRINVFEWFVRYNRFILSSGRMFPGMTLVQLAKFTLTQSPVTIKALNIAAISLNVITFFFLVRSFANRRLALLAAILVVTTLQARVFYESISEITIENQAVWELLLLTMLAAFCYAKRPTVRNIVVVGALYFTACATYEISFLFVFVLIGIIALQAGRKAATRAAMPLGAIFVGFIVLNLIIRRTIAIAATSEYAINPDPIRYLTTLFNQTFSALPLTYLIANPNGIFPNRGAVLFNVAHVAVVVALASFAIVMFILLHRRPRAALIADSERVQWQIAVLLAASIVVIPALLTCLSQRWQQEVKFGLPYQPAYLSGFGFALLIALCIEQFLRWRQRSTIRSVFVVSLVTAATVFATYQSNASVYPIWFSDWKYPYQTLVHSAERGGLGAMPENSVVLFDTNYALRTPDSRYLFYMYTHRRYRVDTPRLGLDVGSLCSVPMRKAFCAAAVPNLFYYSMHSINNGFGRSELLPVAQFDASSLSANHIDVRASSALVYQEASSEVDDRLRVPTSDALNVTPVIDRDNYRLYLAIPRCGTTIGTSSIDGHDVSFGFGRGFYGEENIGGRAFHWGSSQSQLQLINATDLVQNARAVVSFETYVPGAHHLTLRSKQPAISVTLPLHLGASTYTFGRRLPPGGQATIELSTDAPRVPSGTDPRDLRVRVFDYSATAVAGACAVSSAKASGR